MMGHAQSVFHLEGLQADWLPTRKYRMLYRILVGLGGGLVFGLFFGLGFGLRGGLVLALLLGLPSAGVVASDLSWWSASPPGVGTYPSSN